MMDVPVTFGEWLRRHRDEHRLTREEFAGCVGCSVSTLRKIEGGERRPSSQIAGLIADCLNIPPAERQTFVKVARGELTVARLFHFSGSMAGMGRFSASSSSRTNLPELPTPLIGRQRELDDLKQLLSNPECRMLTLVGPGGIGKTRLAIAAASQLQAKFPNGIYFVPLDSVNSADLIVPAIVEAIGFRFERESRSDAKTQLFNYLREKQTLLLMDNLEHLLAGPGIEILAELLSRAPEVKLLATSRMSLDLQGEWIFELQGLPVPESDQAEENLQNTSVELFLQRARRAHAGFNATAQDYSAIVRICQLVEGLPLAIELAAAWVRTLSCNDIAREIERGLDFLSASTRDLPARHRSMRAVFDQSWRLLSEEEQAVLMRLSVFRGGFDREAAEQVADASLTVLFSLVVKSLIRRTGDQRYDLHELIRQYAAEHFSEHPGDKAARQARHGHYYLNLVGRADHRIRSSAQPETLAQLTTEMDNFRVAWDWAIAQHEFSLIEGTLRTFSVYYDVRGWIQEGFDRLQGALSILRAAREQAPSDRTIQVALAHVLSARGLLAVRLGRQAEAQAMLEESLEIIHPLDEPRVLGESLTFLGTVMESTGNYEKARELYARGLEVSSAIGDRWFSALCLMLLAQLASFTQVIRPEETYERLQSVVGEWRAVGDPRFTTLALNLLSLSASNLGRYEEASAALEECAVLSEFIGDRWGVGLAYRALGLVAQEQGLNTEAMRWLHKSLEISTGLGARQDMARALADLGRSTFALGNDQEAEHLWHAALHLALETGGPSGALEALMGLAALQAKRGDTQRAVELLVNVLDHPAAVPGIRKRATALQDEFVSQLTSQQLDSAVQRARAQPFQDAVRDLLKS